MPELSTKPYLIRAIHEWCADCGHTPYLAVVVDDRTVVPRAYVRNGEIVLNVSMSATNRLSIGNELIEFQARFGGAAHELSIPVENVTAIYARETGHGMAFDVPRPAAVRDEPRREEGKRPSRPTAVPSVPRPSAGPEPAPPADPQASPAPRGLPAPSGSHAVETDVAAPGVSQPAGAPADGAASADAALPAPPADAAGADSAASPAAAGGLQALPPPAKRPDAQAAEPQPAGTLTQEAETPGPDEGGGGRGRRGGGRPRLTRVK